MSVHPGLTSARVGDAALGRRFSRWDIHDVLTCLLLIAVTIIALLTVKDYAVSNDEPIQHQYGELIVAYYASGMTLRDVFSFENLYLYGGLFDLVAVLLAKIIPVDPFELRHVLCALAGLGGIAASAATARLIGGARAGLFAALAIIVCGAWYGAMFNHTKDIPFAAAMIGATLFLIRIMRALPAPRAADVLGFGLLSGAALGLRSLGLLLPVYAGLAILLQLPWHDRPQALRVAFASAARMLPAFILAYLVMAFAWPWATLSPLNPIRGLFAFSEFHYPVRTSFAGRVYQMADVPRMYVPIYLLIRSPLIMLFGAAAAIGLLAVRTSASSQTRRDIGLLAAMVLFPLTCQVALHGPGVTGMRHFLFVLPPLAVLAGIGLSQTTRWIESKAQRAAVACPALICACFAWQGANLVSLHPYENLAYNSLVGGLRGAYRNYDLDYWFNSMPEVTRSLEAYLRRTEPPDEPSKPGRIYSVAVCGERPAFERSVTLPQLRWDFRSEWNESDFFIAPTHMNCDRDLDGQIVATVERSGVPIAYAKDRRSLLNPPPALPPRRDVAGAGPGQVP